MFFLYLAAAFAVQTADAPESPSATASTTPELSRYEICIRHLDDDLEAGRRNAQQWVADGGGADARHCLAVADRRNGLPRLAAARLEDIAQRKDAGDDFVRAKILAQASEAWLEAKEIADAERTLAEALALVPDSGELQLTAAKVYAASERWQDVLNAVNAAEEAGIISADNFVFRGRAYHSMGDYERAAQDVVNALTLEPTNIDALLLRGEVQRTGIVIDVFYDPPEDVN